ncbi:tetratricopeptide repeat protein [Microbispora hainanensis]|uniref:Tetratricopeptide repeat protein n=2 Tax=Microbispora hainanensis TaxID=568844 RepID=A0ABZ1STA8_9ACTN|nr:tetratricopeptide repeat protein [Microbispora hainanensis]
MSIGHLVAQYQAYAAAEPERFSMTISESLDDLVLRLGDEIHGLEQTVIADPDIVRDELSRSLKALADRLAEQGHPDNELLARRIVLALSEGRDRLQLARALSELAVPLTALGRLDDAVSVRRRAFRILRTLAKEDVTRWLDVAAEAEPYSALLVHVGSVLDAMMVCRQTVRGLAPLVEMGLDWAREPYARCLLRLAQRVAEDDDLKEGIRLAEKSIEQFRALGGGYGLALALNILSNLKVDDGDLAGALTTSQAALEVARNLADGDYRMTLAMALQTTALRHADLEQWNQAHESLIEAGELFPLLLAEDSGAAPWYASFLSNLSQVQAKLGDADAAVETMERATQLYRDLARQDPAAYLSELALSLVNLSHRHAAIGQHAKAVYALQESIKHYRKLRKEDREWTSDLASAHRFLGDQLTALGQHEPALNETRAAIKLYRECADPHLGESLKILGTRLHNLGRTEESVAATAEAVEIFRTAGDLPQLAHALFNLAITHNVSDEINEAVRSGRESVESYQRLYDDDTGWAVALANALSFLGSVLERAGQFDHAITAVERAVSLLERLYEPGDDQLGADLARALHNLSRYHEEEGRLERALEHMRRSISLYGELTQQDRDRFRPRLASAWLSLAIYLSRLGEAEEARSAAALAVDLCRETGAREDLADALFHLSNREADLGRTEECVAALSAALEIYEELSLVQPDPYLARMAMSLDNLATRYSSQGDPGRALPLLERAADIWGQMDETGQLAGTLQRRLFVQSCLGHDIEETVERVTNIQQDLAVTVRTLNDVAQELIGVELLDPAQQLLARASGLWEIHLLQQPDAEPFPYIHLLDSRATIMFRLGLHEEAAAAELGVVELFEPLAKEDPVSYLAVLATVRARLADYLRAAGRNVESLHHQRQVVETYEKLAASDPSRYRPSLVVSLTDLGELLRDLDDDDADPVLTRAATLRAALSGDL